MSDARLAGFRSHATASHGPSVASARHATEPNVADQTVISTSPPLLLQSPGQAFNPRELGQALEGQQLDHVLLEQFVGGGGMGAVFRAWDTDLVSHGGGEGALDVLRRATSIRSGGFKPKPARPRGSIIRTSPACIMSAKTAASATSCSSTSTARTSATWCTPTGRCRWPTRSTTRCKSPTRSRTPGSARSCIATSSRRTFSSRNDGLAKLVDMGLARLEYARRHRARRNGDRRHAGHVRLHLARAGPQSARCRHAQRHLFARLHAVLHAHGPAAVFRGAGAAEAAPASDGSAAGRARVAAGCARCAGGRAWPRCSPSGRRTASRPDRVGGGPGRLHRATRHRAAASRAAGVLDRIGCRGQPGGAGTRRGSCRRAALAVERAGAWRSSGAARPRRRRFRNCRLPSIEQRQSADAAKRTSLKVRRSTDRWQAR